MKLSTRQMLENHLHEVNGQLLEVERRNVPYSNVDKRRKEQDKIALLLTKTRILSSLANIETTPVQAHVQPASQYRLEIRHLSYDKRQSDETKFAFTDELPAILEEFGTIATIKITSLDDPSRHF